MKTHIYAKSGHHVVNPADQRPAGARPHAAKASEHRYERRKIREQLRRLDWLLNAEDEVLPDTLPCCPGRTCFRC